jgi:hypothetical protein
MRFPGGVLRPLYTGGSEYPPGFFGSLSELQVNQHRPRAVNHHWFFDDAAAFFSIVAQ